jgi:hypothetical protein
MYKPEAIVKEKFQKKKQKKLAEKRLGDNIAKHHTNRIGPHEGEDIGIFNHVKREDVCLPI